jgi:hypothetical protein
MWKYFGGSTLQTIVVEILKVADDELKIDRFF